MASDFISFALRVKGRPALIVGGGRMASRRAVILLKAGAHVRVVTTEVGDGMRVLVRQQAAALERRAFADADIDGCDLVVAATNSPDLNAHVAGLCRAAGIWVNDVSSSKNSSLIFPSLIDRDPIQVSVVTSGAAPTLARMLKSHLKNCIPSGYRELAVLAERYHGRVLKRFTSVEERRLYWRRTIGGRACELALSGSMDGAEREMERLLGEGVDPGAEAGEVYLVGAGPGDPDLLTFKALRLMQKADVVLYDRLVSQPIMDLLPDEAEKIYAGKERSMHAIPQNDINQLLVDRARRGENVLRLKGGDPFIFGRGGEEIEFLASERIPFQIVPGITAASGCASYAGIPLTHRDYAQACVFAAGYLKDGTLSLDWDALARPRQTLIFYMGLQGTEQICAELIAHGLPARTPAALIMHGTRSGQKVLEGDLGNLAALIKENDVKPPTLVIVGEVVRLREKLRWFNK